MDLYSRRVNGRLFALDRCLGKLSSSKSYGLKSSEQPSLHSYSTTTLSLATEFRLDVDEVGVLGPASSELP